MWLSDQRQGSAVLPREITPLSGTGSWLGTTAGLDGLEKMRFFLPRGSSPGLSSL